MISGVAGVYDVHIVDADYNSAWFTLSMAIKDPLNHQQIRTTHGMQDVWVKLPIKRVKNDVTKILAPYASIEGWALPQTIQEYIPREYRSSSPPPITGKDSNELRVSFVIQEPSLLVLGPRAKMMVKKISDKFAPFVRVWAKLVTPEQKKLAKTLAAKIRSRGEIVDSFFPEFEKLTVTKDGKSIRVPLTKEQRNRTKDAVVLYTYDMWIADILDQIGR